MTVLKNHKSSWKGECKNSSWKLVKGNTNVSKYANFDWTEKNPSLKLVFLTRNLNYFIIRQVLGCNLLCIEHLVQGGDSSRGQTVKAETSLDGGDGALKVCRVQQLGELEQAMAQHEEL